MTRKVPAPPARASFRPDIQGLRAVAVGLVLAFHAGVPYVTGGYVGVDVFFVISGFLISTHLLESLQSDGRIGFARFYARRALRILPAALTVAVLTAIAAVLFYPPLGVERILRDALAAILYVPNVHFAQQQTDYLADHSPSPYEHYWSLGIEEQFYLLWPVLLFGIFVLLRRRLSWVVLGILVLAVASLVAGVWLTPIDQPTAFFMLPTRAWELLIGALVGAVLLRGGPRMPAWLHTVGGWVGLAAVMASALIFDEGTAFPGTAAMLPTFGAAALILFGGRQTAGAPGVLLSLAPFQFIGLISYSLYLVHWPLLVIPQAAVGEQTPLSLSMRVLLGIVIALPLAWLLHRFVEQPLRAPRPLTARRPRVTLLAALGVTAVLGVASLGAVQWASVRDVGTGPIVDAAPDAPQAPPNATAFVPRNMDPVLDQVFREYSTVYSDGCHLDVKADEVQDCEYGQPGGDVSIAVFGDSHAAQWLPAVEKIASETSGTSIRTYTKSSCPSVSAQVVLDDVPYLSCDRWREGVFSALEASPPDLVIMSNFAHHRLVDAGDSDVRVRDWTAGFTATVERLRAMGSAVLVVADTPMLPADPATCASASVLDVSGCDGVRALAIDAQITAAERAAAVAGGATYLDVTDYLCTSDVCPIVIDDKFVYRDTHHLTTTFSEYLAPLLAGGIARGLE